MAYDECDGCPLRGRRRVWGEGREDAAVVFVGQSPGSQEKEKGRPFVGPAGSRYDKIFKKLPIDRSDVWTTNVIKCYLPAKASVPDKACKRCWLFLKEELQDRKLIVTLGLPAKETVLKKFKGTTPIYSMIHPAAALREARHEARLRQQTIRLVDVLEGGDDKNLQQAENAGQSELW